MALVQSCWRRATIDKVADVMSQKSRFAVVERLADSNDDKGPQLHHFYMQGLTK